MKTLVLLMLLPLSTSSLRLAALQVNAAAAVQGTVVDSTSAAIQPIYGARVEFEGASENPAVVRSDSLGRFSFSGIAAGRYRVNVAAEGFIRKSMLVTAATGQTNSIQIPLLPAPTMSGHVRDSYNVPISNILVEAIKVIYGPRGDRSVVTLTSALTDDRGEYHLYWLDPGEYYIRGSSLALKPASVLSLLSLASEPPPFAYSPTYHPGTRDPKQAASIRVRSGVNPGPFDFQMLAPTAVSIQGLVMSLNGPGVCGARIILRLAGASASSQQFEGKSSCNPLALGEYGLGGMPPGSYVISVNAVLDGTTLSLHQKRTLNGIDRAITLRVSPGVSVSGVIAPVPGASINFKSLRVVMDSSDPDLPPTEPVQPEADGSFTLKRVEPGDYVIRVLNLPGETYLKSAKSGVNDIRGKPLHVEYTAPPPIWIEIASDGGWMEGIIVDSKNRPQPNAKVVLVPDAARRSFPDQYGISESESDGRFAVHGIPPGEYTLFAWEYIEPNAYLNAAALAPYESLGSPVTIAPSKSYNVRTSAIPED